MSNPTIPNHPVPRLLRPNELENTKHHPLVIICATIASMSDDNDQARAAILVAGAILPRPKWPMPATR